MFEVELKYPVSDLDRVKEKLESLGAVVKKTECQKDEYFDDPLRDFAKLDLALRIRDSDETHYLTFKGRNLDETAKLRHEIEMPLTGEASARQLKDILECIGFIPKPAVFKNRETMTLSWSGREITVCLDLVKGLGAFVELEMVVSGEHSTDAAKQNLLQLASELELSHPTTKSYLNLLIEKHESPS